MSTWVILGSVAYAAYRELYRLPPLGGDSTYTTVSGFAGGGFMADQLQVIYSETFHGAGMINAGPYAIMHYMNVTELDVFVRPNIVYNVSTQASHSEGIARRYSEMGLIDNPLNLKDLPIIILQETVDPIAPSAVQETQQIFYENFGANVTFLQEEFSHTYPVNISTADLPEVSCVIETEDNDQLISLGGEKRQVSNCGYDWAGKVLQHLLPNVPGSNITEILPPDDDWKKSGILRKFNQLEFLNWEDRLNPMVWSNSLDNFGYVFYPDQCAFKKTCKVHVVLHGCGANYELIQFEFIMNSGFGQYATNNDLILLFPQVNGHWRKNSFACWDFGMTSASKSTYNTNEGSQPRAIKRMVDRLNSPKNATMFSDNDVDSFLDEMQITQFLHQIGNSFFTINNLIDISDRRLWILQTTRLMRNLDFYIMFYPWTYGRVYGNMAQEKYQEVTSNVKNNVTTKWRTTWTWLEQNPWIFWIKE